MRWWQWKTEKNKDTAEYESTGLNKWPNVVHQREEGVKDDPLIIN